MSRPTISIPPVGDSPLANRSDDSPHDLSDSELVRRINAGEEAALYRAIRLYGGQMTALCIRICGDELEANSAVSDVFWDLWRNASQYDPERGTLRCYLMTMARSRSLDRFRSATNRKKRLANYLESNAEQQIGGAYHESPEHQPIQAEESQEVQSALERLPILQRQTLILAFFDGLSHSEVSERMGLPLGSVKTHIRTGLLKLRHLLAALRESREYK